MTKPNYSSHTEPIFTALPGSPVDGQIINFLADATNGIVWKLRYRAGSASAFKWEFIGGSPILAEVVTSETTTSLTYAALATAGPSVTLPLAGDYTTTISANYANTGTNTGTMSYDIGATGASDNDAIATQEAVANFPVPLQTRSSRKTGLTASSALVSKYKVTAGTGTFLRRTMSVLPVRVG